MPDEQSAGLRAEVGPLLVAASDGITAVDAAVTGGQGDAIRAAADALTSVQQSLDEFAAEHQ